MLQDLSKYSVYLLLTDVLFVSRGAVQVVGPYDFKVYGSQKAFANRPTEFFIRSEKIQIEEILIIDPNGSYLSCSPAENQNEENLTIEFQPKEIGKQRQTDSFLACLFGGSVS